MTQVFFSSERLAITCGVMCCAALCLQVADLQVALKEEQIIVEEKKAATQALIEGIGREKAVADEAVDASRADEEAAASLQVNTWGLLIRIT